MLDEMIELFSVLNQLEKGALGLFFEMNYLVGVILSIYITWFMCLFDKPTAPAEIIAGSQLEKFLGNTDKDLLQERYDKMHAWLYFHLIYLFVSIIFSLVVFFIYYTINSKLEVKDQKKKETSKVEE